MHSRKGSVVENAAAAAARGSALIEISVSTPSREVLVDITQRVQDAIAESEPDD